MPEILANAVLYGLCDRDGCHDLMAFDYDRRQSAFDLSFLIGNNFEY